MAHIYKLSPKSDEQIELGLNAQSVIKYDPENPKRKLVIPFAEDNTNYQEYLEWVAEGNTPEPADE